MVADAVRFAHAQLPRFVRELQEFVRIPSVSADPAHRADVVRCAEWLSNHLATLGMESRVIATPGHPVVVGRSAIVRGRPTILIYGHYDVQPPDPIAEWRSPPFSGDVVDGAVCGRGASDDKGQILAHVKAIEAWSRSTSGRLPVNVVCVIEGEEETGSRHLVEVLRGLSLRPSAAIASDTPMSADGRPAITLSMRGTLAFELEVRGPERDLHSGLFGGAVLNPAQALSKLLAGLHDSQGRIAIPDLYDDVKPRTREERAQLARDGPADATLAETAAVSQVWGEEGFSAYERTAIRPALTINGLKAGYLGRGVKGVIPARASAKVSLRLSAGQDPARVARLVAGTLRRRCPAAVTLQIRWQSASRPFEFSGDSGLLRVAANACMEGFGKPPALLRSGGTIPVLALFEDAGIPTLLIGFAGSDDGAHAPNERFRVDTFARAIRTSIFLLDGLARADGRPDTGVGHEDTRIGVPS